MRWWRRSRNSSQSHDYYELSVDFEIINMLIPSDAMADLFAYLGPGFSPERFLKPELPPLERLSINQHAAVVGKIEKLVLCRRIQPAAADGLFRIALVKLLSSCFPVASEHGPASAPLWLRWLALEMMKKENFTAGVTAMQRLSGRSSEHLARSCRPSARGETSIGGYDIGLPVSPGIPVGIALRE